MSTIKVLTATTVLTGGALSASTICAYADYSYTFNITGINDGIIGPITGSFSTDEIVTGQNYLPFNSVLYSFNKDGKIYNGSAGMGSGLIYGENIQIRAYGNPTYLGLDNNRNISIDSKNTINTSVDIYVSTGTYASTGRGLFQAMLDSGPSGGGGSGGAPSPEVNVGLGMLLAGATFVFIRRKRGPRLVG